MTVEDWLRGSEAQLSAGPHPERARRDAELLLLHILRKTHPGRNRAWLIAHADSPISPDANDELGALIQRRLTGEPIQYIIGETEFYGMPFRVTPDVLIPRPETEHVVETAIELAKRFSRPRIVDVGCGSGAIAVALAHSLPGARVTATDISSPALEIARENAARNGVADRIRFIQGDLLWPVAGERFELIVSNPPYVAIADRESLAVEVREFEPAQALFAGEAGLDVIRRLIPAAFEALVPGGRLVMEFGYGQWPAIGALLVESGFEQVEAVCDLQGIPRVACSRRP